MRIYTEVIFQWDDKQNKLVEVSSQSEEYSGRVDLCTWWVQDIGVDAEGNKWRVRADSKRFGGYKKARIWRAKYNPETRTWDGFEEMPSGHFGMGTGFGDRQKVIDKAEEVIKSGTGEYYDNYDNYVLSKAGEEGATPDDEFGESDDARIKEIAVDAIKGLTADWDRITTGDSEYQRAITASLDAMNRAGEGVGETYIDPETGDEKSIEGTLAQAEADYATSVARAGEDLDTATEAAGRGREVALGTARAGYAPAIREAEAAAAATGFAGTGAGEQARAELAEEFMGDVEAAETGFEVETEAAATAEARTVETAETAYGEAEANFASIKAAHEQTISTQQANAQTALRGLQKDMTGIIEQARTDLDDNQWSPFTQVGSTLKDEGGRYGWKDLGGFDPTIADAFKLTQNGGA